MFLLQPRTLQLPGGSFGLGFCFFFLLYADVTAAHVRSRTPEEPAARQSGLPHVECADERAKSCAQAGAGGGCFLRGGPSVLALCRPLIVALGHVTVADVTQSMNRNAG